MLIQTWQITYDRTPDAYNAETHGRLRVALATHDQPCVVEQRTCAASQDIAMIRDFDLEGIQLRFLHKEFYIYEPSR